MLLVACDCKTLPYDCNVCVIQVGVYDPYGDDLQLSVQRSALSCSDETLFISGSSGQVIVMNFSTSERQLGVKVKMLIEVESIMHTYHLP
jgi:hypothetical protein